VPLHQSHEPMKILLIQPPVRDFYQTSIRTQPIGLAYLAASLVSHGHAVEILDCQTRKKKAVPIPSELSYLKDLYPFEDRSPFKLYSGFYHFGMDRGEIKQRIEGSGADVFGISSHFTPYHQEALEIARIIKMWDRRKVVAMGGAHVSCDPQGVLESPFVDCVILGEGEIRLPLLLDAIERGKKGLLREIDGIGYRIDGEKHIQPLRRFIENLDGLPFPARELLPLDHYRMRQGRSTMIVTSRGCPHACTYCSTRVHMGAMFRTRSVENILEEMKVCWDRHGIRMYDFEDDNFTFDQVRAKSLMRLLIETFGKGRLELTAMNGVSLASLDRELLELMKQAGFHTINLSFVSLAPSVRERLGRPGLDLSFDEVLEALERVGLHAVVYAILGIPGQTIGEMVETLVYLAGKRILIGPSIYYPVPRTSLFQRCQEEGLLPFHPIQWRSTALPIVTSDFNRLDLVTLFRLARLINFIKRKMDEGVLEEGVTLKGLRSLLKGRHRSSEINEVNWVSLLVSLSEERSLFGLRKGSKGTLSVMRIETSKKVLESFFEKGWERPILGSRLE
jgi:anaerobic magnesium-protoporphyrin IX monomethyl ester cyclase